MFSSWDMMHLEAVGQGLFFQIAKTTVWDVMERSVGEQPKKWFVVDCYSEIVATKNEMLLPIPSLDQSVARQVGFDLSKMRTPFFISSMIVCFDSSKSCCNVSSQ